MTYLSFCTHKMRVKKIICAALVLFCVINGMQAGALSVSAAAAAVIAGDTGEIIYALNENDRMPMASTTKIMTALLLCEYGGLEREISVTEEMTRVEGSSMGLLPGDTVSLRALLYGLLLASGNDAANTVAIVLGGSVDAFVEQMNRRAAQMGLKNTHFATPSGLDADDHYTTALELALLAREAMKNPDFAAAAGTEYETVYYGNPPYRRGLKNHNRLLREFNGAVGVKTGFTKKSGRCLVSAARRDGKYVIAVTLNAPDDWNDHRAMLEYGLSAVNVSAQPFGELPRLSCAGGNKDMIGLKTDPMTFGTVSEKTEVKLKLPKFVYAPVKAGEWVGTAEYYSGERLVGSSAIYSTESSASVRIPAYKRLIAAVRIMLAEF